MKLTESGNKDLRYQNIVYFLAEYVSDDCVTTLGKDIEKYIYSDISYGNTVFRFTDDIWDFKNEAEISGQKKYSVWNFKSLKNSDMEAPVKLYYLERLFNEGPTARNYSARSIIIRFALYIEKKGISSFDMLNQNTINSFFETANVKERTKWLYCSAIKNFLEFIERLTGTQISEAVYQQLNTHDSNLIRSESAAGKLPLLPSDFMKRITDIFYENVYDTGLSNKKRHKSALLYICTQTGLRPTELGYITADSVKKIPALDAYILEYTYTKFRGSGKRSTKTVLNSKAAEVIKQIAKFSDGKYIEGIRLRDYLREVCLENAEKLNIITDTPDSRFAAKPIQFKDKWINIPQVKQFRVYFCSELRARNFSYLIVAKLLNHSDEKMFDYYMRPASSQENHQFADTVLDEIQNKGTVLLGPQADKYTNLIRRKMDDRITVKDIETIVSEVDSEICINPVEGAFCIKVDSGRPCSYDKNFDTLYCSYGICPNQHHFYYYCTYYYDKYLEYKKLINKFAEDGTENMRQKQVFILKRTIQERLIPELDELEHELERRGEEEVIRQHPYLINIIADYKSIREEIEKWLSMN